MLLLIRFAIDSILTLLVKSRTFPSRKTGSNHPMRSPTKSALRSINSSLALWPTLLSGVDLTLPERTLSLLVISQIQVNLTSLRFANAGAFFSVHKVTLCKLPLLHTNSRSTSQMILCTKILSSLVLWTPYSPTIRALAVACKAISSNLEV